jgi:hypothetical protein
MSKDTPRKKIYHIKMLIIIQEYNYYGICWRKRFHYITQRSSPVNDGGQNVAVLNTWRAYQTQNEEERVSLLDAQRKTVLAYLNRKS